MRNVSHIFQLPHHPINILKRTVPTPSMLQVELPPHLHQTIVQLLKTSEPIPFGVDMVGNTHIQYPLRGIWVANCMGSDSKQNNWWVRVWTIHLWTLHLCMFAFVLTPSSYFWASDIQLFQCPSFLQKSHWFFFKLVLNFDLSWTPLLFRLKLLPLTINTSIDALLEDSLLIIDKGENKCLIVIIQ